MVNMYVNLRMAETAVRLLRDGLNRPTGYKRDAQQHAAAVRAHVASAQATVGAIRKSLVAEVDRLTNDADRVLQELDDRSAYRGPLRSQMTAQAQADYIGKHGKERYLALPW